jgi:hypothetical protein
MGFSLQCREQLSGDLNATVCNKKVHNCCIHIFGLSIYYYLDQGQQQPVQGYPATQLTGTQYQDSDGRDYTPIDMPIPAPLRYQLDKLTINVIKNTEIV